MLWLGNDLDVMFLFKLIESADLELILLFGEHTWSRIFIDDLFFVLIFLPFQLLFENHQVLLVL